MKNILLVGLVCFFCNFFCSEQSNSHDKEYSLEKISKKNSQKSGEKLSQDDVEYNKSDDRSGSGSNIFDKTVDGGFGEMINAALHGDMPIEDLTNDDVLKDITEQLTIFSPSIINGALSTGSASVTLAKLLCDSSYSSFDITQVVSGFFSIVLNGKHYVDEQTETGRNKFLRKYISKTRRGKTEDDPFKLISQAKKYKNEEIEKKENWVHYLRGAVSVGALVNGSINLYNDIVSEKNKNHDINSLLVVTLALQICTTGLSFYENYWLKKRVNDLASDVTEKVKRTRNNNA